MIHGILFDFDGTLVDSNQSKNDCFYEVVAHIPQAEDLMRVILANPRIGDRNEVFAELARRLFLDDDADEKIAGFVGDYTRLTEERVGSAPKRAGAREALEGLAAMGMPMCISSATPCITLQRILDLQDISSYFEEIFGASQTKTEHIEAFARQLGCTPGQLLYVGDSEIDRTCAMDMGCTFIGVGDDASRFAGKQPERLIADLSVLPALVAEGDVSSPARLHSV